MARKSITGWTVVLCKRKKKDFSIQRHGLFRITFWKYTLTFYPFYQDNVVRNLQKEKRDLFSSYIDLYHKVRELEERLTKDNQSQMDEQKNSGKDLEWASTTVTSVETKIQLPLNTLGQSAMSAEGTTVGAGTMMDVQSVGTTSQMKTQTQ